MGVARVYRAGSPYNGVELADLDLEQNADTLYLAHLDHPPAKLVRRGHADWEVASLTFGPAIAAPAGVTATATVANTDADNDGNGYFPQSATYVVTAVNDESGQESRASVPDSAFNDLTLKRNYNGIGWSAVAGASRYNLYKADNSQFYGYIGTTEDLFFRDDNIGPALDRAPPQGDNPFAAAGDYPSTVTFHEQRLLFARTANHPNAVWGSRAGTSEFENFDRSRPLRDSDAYGFAIAAGRVNAVNQLVSTTSLIALTGDAIFNVDGDGQGGVLTANAQAVRRQVGRGCARLNPLLIDNVVFYRPSVGNAVRTLNYAFEVEGLKSNDVSIFSPHLFEGHDIVSWAYAQEPRSLVWAARADGKLLCFTWEQEQNVWGWTYCETDGRVLSVCAISEGGEDRLYLIVERDMPGGTRRFVERMAAARWEDVAESCYLDCAVSAEFDVAQASFTGLWHLEGRSDVAGIVDGAAVTGLSVTGGRVTLPPSIGTGRKVTFGLPYAAEVRSLPLRVNMEGEGWTIGRRQQAGQIVLDLADTRSIRAGVAPDKLFPVKQRLDEAWGDPDALMNGAYLIDSANHVSGDAEVHVRQDAPLPFTLLGLFMEPVIGG